MRPDDLINPQKLRTGTSRMWHALLFSLQGLRAGWGETAFRQEALASLVALPVAFWLGNSWLETAVLVSAVVMVMVVELLNTAVESVVDRVSPEWHALSKRAKDMGSAAVLLTLTLCAGIWLTALWHKVVA
jgi:diacylglycerol kinase (ATP)